jgi:hypothetical protein
MKNVFESEGEIREVDPLAALVTCWRERTTGTLRFARGASECGFDLDEGEVVAVVSSDPRFETAAILVRAGKLSTEAVERLAPQGGDPALAALQTGLLTRREWKWGEKIRAIEVLSDLLAWSDGRYAFDAGARPKAGDFRVPVPRLLLELFLRSRDRNLVDHQLGSPEQTLVRGERFDVEFPTFGLTADAESVVRLIDGRSTAAEIAEKAPADEFAVRKLLAALVTLGLVHPVPVAPAWPTDRAPEREFQPEPFPQAEPPPEARADEFAATLDLPSRGEWSPAALETEIPAVESAPDGEADREMVDLPSAPASPLDRFEPGPPAGGWEAELPRPPSDGPWGYGPEIPEPPDSGEPPAPSGGGLPPLVWSLVILLAAVAGLVIFRGRSAAPVGTIAAVHATPLPAVTFPPPVTAVRAEAGLDRTRSAWPAAFATTAVPALAPTATAAMPTARRAAPTAAPSRGEKGAPAQSAVKPTPMPSRAAAQAPSEPPATWQARAARDRRRLEGDRRALYSIQLELVCEPASLEEAWRHDRSQLMWLLTVTHGGRDCFRVFWGRYPTLEAAKKAKTGIPSYFVTARNRPAVVSVR